MKPKYIKKPDYEKFVYAYCRCPYSTKYALKISRVKGQAQYPFYCEECGTSGVVHSLEYGNFEDFQ